MSEILGYDIDGKPLRAGDECVVINPGAPKFYYTIGATCRVTGPWGDHLDTDLPDPDDPGLTLAARGRGLRKISNNQRGTESYTDQFTPADTSFHELLGQISKQGAKA